MPKFSDSPYFLLKDYIKWIAEPPELDEKEDKDYLLWDGVLFQDNWDEYKKLTTNDDEVVDGVTWEPALGAVKWNAWYNKVTYQMINSYFRRPNDIIVRGGNFIELFIKDVDYGFRPIRLIPVFEDPIEKIYFRFTDYELKRTIPNNNPNDHNEVFGKEWECGIEDYKTYNICPGGGFNYYFKDWHTENKLVTNINDHIGQEVYFRKDSNFYEWLKESAYSYYIAKWEYEFNIRNYVNTDKNFLYFGQIYPSRIEKTEDDIPLFHIVFEGIKDFVRKSIPDHQRTFRMLEYLEIYFDRIYHEIYNLQKNIYSLYDPKEIDEKYLHYLSMRYNINLDQNILTYPEQREFVRDIIFLLKRKGTYNCFQILWKIISGSNNTVDILEKWHDKDLTGKIPEEEYVNIPYTDFYTKEVSANNLELSTSYRVEFNLDLEPFTALEIEPSYLCNSLYNHYELFRPVNRVSNYAFTISPITDFTGQWISLYENTDYYKHLLTRYTMNTEYTRNSYIHIQWNEGDTWYITHGLNSSNILVQVIDFNLKKIVPEQIIYNNNKDITIKFDHPINGAVLLKKADWFAKSTEPIENWILKHDLDTQEALVQVKHKSLESSSITNINNIEKIINEDEWLNNGDYYYKDISHNLNHRYPFITIWNLNTNMKETLSNIISIDYNTIRLESEYPFDLKAIFFKDVTLDTNINITNSDWIYNGSLYYKIINHNLNSAYLNSILWNNDTNTIEKMAKIIHSDSNNLIISAANPINANILLCRSRTSKMITNWVKTTDGYYSLLNHNMNLNHPIITTWNTSTKEVEIYKDIEYINENTLKIYSENKNAIRMNINFILYNDLEELEEKLYTSDIQLTNINEVKIEDIGKDYISMISNPDYVVYFITEENNIWNIEHGLNKRGIMAQFYDENNYKINPIDYEIISNNNIKITFEENLKGYAVLKNIGHYFLNNSFIPDEFGNFDLEFKAGTEENSLLKDGIVFTKDINNIYIENNIYYIPITIPIGIEEYSIREMGIFEKSTGDMIVYTKCYEIFKHKNFELSITYRISKDPLI